MKWSVSFGMPLVLLSATLSAQNTQLSSEMANATIEGSSRIEVVDEVWLKATQGELMNPDGWAWICRRYTNPTPFPGNKDVLVVSNDWGLAFWDTGAKNDRDIVSVGYTALGKVDSSLRFVPSPPAKYMKTFLGYHVDAVPEYSLMFGADGKTLVEKKYAGYRAWKIQGSPGIPWTTVNTAIRYVLEKREKTSDPAIKKNADETLAKLLRLH